MSVYYVHAPELGLVKIGTAGDPVNRFCNMQTGSPSRLVLLAWEEGSGATESERHTTFAELRRRGEWFAYEGALKAHVEALSPYTPAPRKFGPTDLSKATGWAKGYCSMLLAGTRPITLEKSAHIYATCGRKLGPLMGATDADCQALLRLCTPQEARAA